MSPISGIVGLKDMGYDNPDEMRIKFALANSIALTIEDLGLRQVEAAKLTGLAQSDISRIVNGNVKDVAVFRLMRRPCFLGKGYLNHDRRLDIQARLDPSSDRRAGANSCHDAVILGRYEETAT